MAVDFRKPFSISASASDTGVLARDHYALSLREDQVLARMWLGMSDGEIGFDLSISAATVREYKKRLQSKVGATRPSEILGCAIRGLPHVMSSH